MSSWTNDVDESEEDDSEEEAEDDSVEFLPAFEKAVRGSGSPSDVGEVQLVQNLDDVEDVDLLKEAWLEFDGEKQNLIKKRLQNLGVDPSRNDDPEPSEDASVDDGGDEEVDGGSWGGTTGDDTEGESGNDATESSDSSSEATSGDTSTESEPSESAPEPAIESAEEVAEAEADGGTEPAQDESSGASAASGPPTPSNAMTPDEAATRDRRWKVMVWGPPKLFKTHFCYTMPEPVAYIDTEGKADDIAAKFAGKNIQIWPVEDMDATPDTKFRRAKKALDEALEWLDWYYENENKIGTIVVDSMSLIWEWAQRHHKLENYPMKDEEDIELSSNFKSSAESDWAVIKEYHNGEFRERITSSRYHFCWTAMERVDFERQLDGESSNDVQFMEPVGEPKNDYKVDTLIHAREDANRGKVGDMTGTNFTDNKFVGLKKPTFPKVKNAVEEILSAEAADSGVSRGELATEIDAEDIIDHDPQVYVNQ